MDKVGFTATDLELAYTASPQTIQITGTAGASIGNIGNLSVSFPNSGVVIASGSLESLDASITGSFTIAKVGFTATDLELAYTASPQTIQITGTAGASIGNIGSLSVSFPNSGVVIASGSLVSLDASITGSFTIAKVGVHGDGPGAGLHRQPADLPDHRHGGRQRRRDRQPQRLVPQLGRRHRQRRAPEHRRLRHQQLLRGQGGLHDQ